MALSFASVSAPQRSLAVVHWQADNNQNKIVVWTMDRCMCLGREGWEKNACCCCYQCYCHMAAMMLVRQPPAMPARQYGCRKKLRLKLDWF
jgi:hypothetical protein